MKFWLCQQSLTYLHTWTTVSRSDCCFWLIWQSSLTFTASCYVSFCWRKERTFTKERLHNGLICCANLLIDNCCKYWQCPQCVDCVTDLSQSFCRLSTSQYTSWQLLSATVSMSQSPVLPCCLRTVGWEIYLIHITRIFGKYRNDLPSLRT